MMQKEFHIYTRTTLSKIHEEFFNDVIQGIQYYTPYKACKHIAYAKDSLVYSSKDSQYKPVVLKIIKELEYESGSKIAEAISEGIDVYSDITLSSNFNNAEIYINKYLTASQDENLASPLSWYLCTHVRQAYEEERIVCSVETRYYIFVFPKYATDLHRQPICDLKYKYKLSILIHICKGIKSLHEMGYYHGDLKPPNVCLTDLGQVKLIDFGTSEWSGDVHANYYLKNTWGWTSLKQAWNHIQDKECKENLCTGLSNMDKINFTAFDVLLSDYFEDEEISDILPESLLINEKWEYNDVFGACLLVMYVLGDGYNMWCRGPMKGYDTMKIIHNMEEYIKDKDSFIRSILQEVKIDEDSVVGNELYKGLISGGSLTTIDRMIASLEIERE